MPLTPRAIVKREGADERRTQMGRPRGYDEAAGDISALATEYEPKRVYLHRIEDLWNQLRARQLPVCM